MTDEPTPIEVRTPGRAAAWRGGISRSAGLVARPAATFAGVALVWLAFSLLSEYFLTGNNIRNILIQASSVAIVAAGLTVVLIAAEIDLSFGALEAATGAAAALLVIEHGAPIWVGILAALGVGIGLGFVNGLVTWKLAIPSFIGTLAMLGIAQGSAFLFTGGRPIFGFPEDFREIGTGDIAGLPIPVVLAVLVYATLHVLLTQTRFGRHIFAVGGSSEAARLAGINVGRVKLWTFVISGTTAAIAGLILSSRLNAGDGRFGEEDLLLGVAAVVLGGTSLFGGVGSVIGTAAGVLLIVSVKNGLVLINVQDYWQRIVIGLIILAAMLVDQVVKGERSHLFSALGGRRRAAG